MSEIPPSLLPFSRSPVSAGTIDAWRLFDLPLPANARAFYELTNGLDLTSIGAEILSLETAAQAGKQLHFHPVSQLLGLLPISESNDSNPYCLVIGRRLCGAVILLSHDGDVQVTHDSLESFLQSLALLVESNGESIDDLSRGEVSAPQIVADADRLLADSVGQVDTEWDALLPLVSACSVPTLIRLLDVDDMWVREAAALRCGRLRCQTARESLTKLADAGTAQDNNAARRSLAELNRES